MRKAPSPSTNMGIVGVPIAVILSWVLAEFFQVQMPPHVEAAMGAFISTVFGYFALGGKREDVE